MNLANRQKNRGQEAEKFWYPEVWNKEYMTGHASAQGFHDYDSGDEREQQIISWAIDNNGPIPSREALSQLYPANCNASLSAPGQVYNFSHCSVTLNIAGNDAFQKSTSDI